MNKRKLRNNYKTEPTILTPTRTSPTPKRSSYYKSKNNSTNTTLKIKHCTPEINSKIKDKYNKGNTNTSPTTTPIYILAAMTILQLQYTNNSQINTTLGLT